MQTYCLNNHNVRRLVPADAIGFYRLGTEAEGKFSLTYFGRSDTSLRQRLLFHARARLATHFQFVLTETIYQAFALECSEWHLHPIGATNVIHPDAPRWIAYGCPWCQFERDPALPGLARAITGAFS